MLRLAATIIGCLVTLVPFTSAASGDSYTLIVAASTGGFSGYNELKFIQEAFVPDPTMNFSVPACQGVQVGGVAVANGTKQVKVVLLMAGIGPTTAGICLSQFLIGVPFTIEEIITVGTSGISPMMGGLSPENGCAPLAKNATRPLSLGSACVTSLALNVMCGYCSEANSSAPTNQCTNARCSMDAHHGSPGRCVYHFDDSLAQRVRTAASRIALPTMRPALKAGVTKFWAVNSAAVEGMTSDDAPTEATVEHRCGETDTAQMIAPSGELNQQCRTYLAQQLSPLTTGDVACWNAMEGVGYGAALVANPGGLIPIAFVRSGSNYDTYPLTQTDPGVWVAKSDFMNTTEYIEYTKEGYRFAVETSNAIVLAYLASKTPE